MECARKAVEIDPGECKTRPRIAWRKDGSQGRQAAGRTDAPRPDSSQFRSTASDLGVARSDPPASLTDAQKRRKVSSLCRQLRELGYDVTVTTKQADQA